MANQPIQIHQFPREFQSLNPGDFLPVSQNGLTGKISIENLQKSIQGSSGAATGIPYKMAIATGNPADGELRSAVDLTTIAVNSTITIANIDRNNDDVAELWQNALTPNTYIRVVDEADGANYVTLKILSAQAGAAFITLIVSRSNEHGAIATAKNISIDVFSSPGGGQSGGASFLPSAAAILRVRFDNASNVPTGIAPGRMRFNDALNGNPTFAYIHELSDNPEFYLHEFLSLIDRGTRIYFMRDPDNLIVFEARGRASYANQVFTVPLLYGFAQGTINNNDLLGGTLVYTPTGRDKPQNEITFYVRSDGNNNNTGEVDSPNFAFADWQYAINYASRYFDTDQDVIIQAGGSGVRTFSPGTLIVKPIVGGGRLVLRGDLNNPENCIFSGSNNPLMLKVGQGTACVEGFKFTNPFFNQNTTFVQCNEGLLQYRNLDFGALTQAAVASNQMHILVSGGQVQPIGNYKITAGMGLAHIFSRLGGKILRPDNPITVTITNTPVFISVVHLTGGSNYDIPGSSITWSGNVDAGNRKYTVELNSILRSQGGAASIPGTNTSVASGGQVT